MSGHGDRLRHMAQRYRTILAYTGLVWAVASVPIAAPLLLLLLRPQEHEVLVPVAVPALALLVSGTALWCAWRPSTRPALGTAEGAVIVVLAWFGAVGAAAAAFAAAVGLDATQAVFESASAWTTTGLSVVDVAHAPETVLLLRSTLQLAGGAGLAILMVATASGPAGIGLSSAEAREDQLVPHVVRSASIVVRLYAAYAVLGVAALHVAGMGWLDAVNHSFAAVSTGGFSTRADSIGAWDDPWIEGVTIVLMLLGATNFVTAYALVRGRFRAVARNAELRLTALLLPLGAALVFAFVAVPLHASLPRAARIAVFEVASALTTTGYSTTTYGSWPAVGWIVMIALMLVGGGTGSTAGGLKQARVSVLGSICRAELRRAHLPAGSVCPPRTTDADGARVVLDDDTVRRTTAFVFLYAVTLLVGTTVIAACGYDLRSALFEMSSALGTVGLSVGVTAPGAPGAVLWTETAAMLLGRLEFVAVVLCARRVGADLLAYAAALRAARQRAHRTIRARAAVRPARPAAAPAHTADRHASCPGGTCAAAASPTARDDASQAQRSPPASPV